MNSRMTYWREIQDRFYQFENTLRQLSGGYVSKVELTSLTASLKASFEWVCHLQTESGRFIMYLDWADTRSAAFTSLTEGKYEPQIEKILVTTLGQSKNQIFVDIGANEGFHTLNCLTSIPGASAIAFEPNPEASSKLKKNLHVNGLVGRAVVHSVGLSAIQDEQDFYVPTQTGSGGGSLINLHPEEGRPKVLRVQLAPLDVFDLRPAVMKIDVEGNELSVLKGARRTLELHRPYLVIELMRKWMAPFGTHPQQAANYLFGLGYRMYAIGETSIKKIETITDATEETNFFFAQASENFSGSSELIVEL